MAFVLTGALAFDGENVRQHCAVVVDGPRIVAVGEDVDPSLPRIELNGGILAPGFIDVQVNGGGGALLNATPDAETVKRIATAHRWFGTTSLLPTVITDAPDVIRSSIAAVREARALGLREVLGIHIEGPFLDEVRKGAHDARFIREMTAADVDEIIAADCGIVMLTVAPNRVAPEFIRRLSDHGVLVSLGHAEASYGEASAALNAGARAFTHLYNAMSQLGGRAPGMAGAALTDAESYIGIIADGHHVHDAALKVAFAMKPERIMLVSDAMAPAAGGPDTFALQGRAVTRRDGRLELEPGTLAGSNLTMDEAVRYCVNNLGMGLGASLAMASRIPAAFLQRDRDLGRIAPGYMANLVHLDDSLKVTRTWVEGA